MTVVIGTAGHIDHGKTALLRALTGIDADRLPEERRRGMTIDVGYAHLALPSGEAARLRRRPGARPARRQHAGRGRRDRRRAAGRGRRRRPARPDDRASRAARRARRSATASRVVTKTDVAGPERTAEVVAAVGRLLDGTSLAGSPVVAVSSVTGDGIEGLRDALAALARAGRLGRGGRAGGATGSRLAIDRVFAVKGRGDRGDRHAPRPPAGPRRDPPARAGRPVRPGPRGPGPRTRRSRRPDPVGPRSTWPASRPATSTAAWSLTDDPAVVASDRVLVRLVTTLPDRARARVHLGTAAVDATVGRSGRDALDLPDGTSRRRSSASRSRSRSRPAIGWSFVARRGADRIVGAVVLDPLPARGISRRRQTARAGRPARRGRRGAMTRRDRGRPTRPAWRRPSRGAGPGSIRLRAGCRGGRPRADLLAAVDPAIELTAARAVAARALRRQATIERRRRR